MNFPTEYMYYSINNSFNEVAQVDPVNQSQEPQFMFFDQCYMPYSSIGKVDSNQPDSATNNTLSRSAVASYPLFDENNHLAIEELYASNSGNILVGGSQFPAVISDNPSRYSSGSSDFHTSPDNKLNNNLQSSVIDDSPNPMNKPKRKRISTIAQRRAANIR